MSTPRPSRVTDASDAYFATQLTPRQIEERVAAHLVDRQFLEADDLKIALGQKGEPVGAEPFLARCASNRLITSGQSKRIREELQELMRTVVPGYVLEKQLGRGSTSVVYRATQMCLNRPVALKVLDGIASARQGATKAFLDSTSKAASLSHPALVSVYHAGIAAGRPYCAMDLVLVPTLDQILASQGPLGIPILKRIATQALELLTYLESKGVVHRDIKPGNLFLDIVGHLRVGDLGLALWANDSREQRAQERGLAMGTPHYMAPEQILGEKIDSRADLYSLGVTLFHLASGRTPFAGSTPSEVQDCHLSSPIPDIRQLRPDMPQDLVDLAKRLMAKDPTRRGTCAENLERWRTASTRPMAALPVPAAPAVPESVGLAPPVEQPPPGIPPWVPWIACWAMGALLLASVVAHALRP